MKPNKDFDIEFVGLKLGLHDFDYTIENTFFQDIDFIKHENKEPNLSSKIASTTPLDEFAT